MEYGRIIKRSLAITWRHKVLWVFGILAVLFGAGSNGDGGNKGQMFTQRMNEGHLQQWERHGPWGDMGPFGPSPWDNLSNLPWEGIVPIAAAIIAILILVGIVLLIISVIVRYTSEGALIGMVEEIEETEATTSKAGLKRGWRRLLRLLAMDILIGLAAFIVVMVILVVVGLVSSIVVVAPAALLIASGGAARVVGIVWAVGTGLVFLLLLILAMMALAAVVTLVREYAFRASVLELDGIKDALARGWHMLRTQSRESLLMWLILVGIDIVISVLTIPAVIAGLALTALSGAIGYGITSQVPVAVIAAAPFLLVLIGALIVVSGIYFVFKSTVWTLTFRELESQDLLA